MAEARPNPSRRSGSLKRVLTGIGGGDGIHPASKLRKDEEMGVGNLSSEAENGTTPRFTQVALDSNLTIFRAMTGINTAHGLTILEGVNRPASNIGIYTQVIRHEKQAGKQYQFFRLLINFCLAVQLISAAALTSLGAGNGPRSAVTGLGAINTVIAGFLTYLKGSGLPNRKRYYTNQWAKVRQYIEQREREFCLEGSLLDVEEEIIKVEQMFQEVTMDIEANVPEGYVGSANSQSARNNSMPPSALPSNSTRDNDHVCGSRGDDHVCSLSRDNTRRSLIRVPEKVAEQGTQP